MPRQARNVLELQERHHEVEAESEVRAATTSAQVRLLRVEVETENRKHWRSDRAPAAKLPNYKDHYEKTKLRM